MKRIAVLAFLGMASCGSCDKSDSNKPAATAEPSASTSAALNANEGGPPSTFGKHIKTRQMMSGTPGMLFQGARTLTDLKDEQKAKIEKAEEGLKGDDTRDERRAFQTDLSAGVKVGKLDQAKIDADLAAMDKAMKERQDKEASALDDLYAALEPAQRTSIVAKIRERIAAREAHMPDGGGGDGGRGRPPGEAFAAGKRLERLTKDLDLDAEQQKKVDALKPKDDPKAGAGPDPRAESKKRTDALLAAFEKDGFDAKKLDLGDGKMARSMADQEVKLMNGLIPILKPEQRERLAAKMESMDKRGAHRRGPGGGGHGRGGGGGDDDRDDEEPEP